MSSPRRMIAFFLFIAAPGVHTLLSQSTVWNRQYIGENQYTWSVKTVSPLIAWVCGNAGVFNTSDGGSSWYKSISGSFPTIEVTTDGVVLAASEKNKMRFIHRSSDQGRSWTIVYTDSTFIDGIRMFDRLNGIAVGDPLDSVWHIIRTSDGGLTWNLLQGAPKMPKCEVGHINSIAVAHGRFVWFGTIGCGGHRVYQSTDRGTTWTAKAAPFDDSYGIWFIDSLRGVVAFSSGFYRTSDGGTQWTWNNRLMSGTFNVCGVENGDCWATGDSAVYRSTDAGATWIEQYRQAARGLWHLSFVLVNGVHYGWVAAADGYVLKYAGQPTSITQKRNVTVSEYELHQCYPNPFNPSTTIAFDIPTTTHVSLHVYDCLGRQVAVLVDRKRASGHYEERFDASTLRSGVYFYRLTAGSFSAARKMLVAK